MAREYRFLDRWVIPARPDVAYDVVGEALLYPAWWRSFCLRASGDPGPPAPGKRADLLVKGFLPYRVRLTLECEVAEPPARLVSRIDGDLVGRGEWTFEPAFEGTRVTLDWRPSVARPLLRALSPGARPLLRANHAWCMTRGEREIAAFVADPARMARELARVRSGAAASSGRG